MPSKKIRKLSRKKSKSKSLNRKSSNRRRLSKRSSNRRRLSKRSSSRKNSNRKGLSRRSSNRRRLSKRRLSKRNHYKGGGDGNYKFKVVNGIFEPTTIGESVEEFSIGLENGRPTSEISKAEAAKIGSTAYCVKDVETNLWECDPEELRFENIVGYKTNQ
jgi:hypothetical protein